MTNRSTTVEKQDKDKQQEILKVIPQQNLYSLGKHLLFRGDPNSQKFLQHLPSEISLNLAFPTDKNWLFGGERYSSQVSFHSEHYYDFDLQLLLEAIERYIKITTDGGDNITICFIPHPDILLLAHRLDCRCFIAEPESSKCEALLAAWKDFELNK